MSLKNAFNTLLFIHKREVTIERPTSITAVTIFVSPSNYSRNLQGPEEIVMDGREFVVSLKSLSDVNYPMPKRGDRIKDPQLGVCTVTEVREMYDFGGNILGYRIRTE